MKKIYTQQDINQFFEQFKKLSGSYELEKVHQLINNPNAKAMHRVKFNYKTFKFIIMTSAFIVGVSTLLILLIPNKTDNDRSFKDYSVNSEYVKKKYDNVPDAANKVAAFSSQNSTKPKNRKKEINQSTKKDIKNDLKIAALPKNIIETVKSCSWPIDTTLDKHSLFIYLTNDELLNLGVYLYADSMYYCNQRPDSSYYVSSYNAKGNKNLCNHFKFCLADNSDTLCTKHRWGDLFYNRIDTLVPIVIKISDETMILWFTPHPDIFSALPDRYKYLEHIYQELKCIKRKNPEHQIVNYWNKSRNQVLDEINYLVLNNEELGNIGIEIFKDSISIVDPTQSFKYTLDAKMLNCGTYGNNGIAPPAIPNMFPVMFTDIKGLNQGTFGTWIKSEEWMDDENVFSTLIPILLPLSDLIKGLDYQLILWYYPSEGFLKALPDRYRKDIYAELEYIITGESNQNSNCTYFEDCKSTLLTEDFRIYPNPADLSTIIAFTLHEAVSGRISLVNISGSQVKVIVPNTKFISGHNSFTVDLSGITPGIYLVSILTNKGFKTKRIIISKN